MIKNLWLKHKNSDWTDRDFVIAGIITLSLICAVLTGVFTYWGLTLFGPWFQDSAQIWFFTWGSVVAQQFYFWWRWMRYTMLHRQNRLNSTTGEITRKWFKFKFKSSAEKQREIDDRKLQERRIALGFVNDIRK